MIDVALGIDTSCYTTSVATVDADGVVHGFERQLLPVPKGQRGLRQSEAVFVHVRQLPALMERLSLADMRIRAVSVSEKPRDEADSYMPVFETGAGTARSIAAALRVPCYGVSHQQGHIAAGMLGNPPMDKRFVALHLSGGTTELLLSDEGKLTLLGGSLDLHAGQLVDRVGVAMGLPFPAGAELEKLAMACTETVSSMLPVSMERGDLQCHLSGAETQCQRLIGSVGNELLAAEVFDLLARTVARLLAAGCRETGTHEALVVGGVASSTLLRELVCKRLHKLGANVDARFGQPRYSADNAAGVAWLGMQRYLKERSHTCA